LQRHHIVDTSTSPAVALVWRDWRYKERSFGKRSCVAERTDGWLGWIRASKWRIGNRALSPVREKTLNLFPLKFISNSKRSNFQDRTERMESRASERNGPFGE